RVSAHGRGILVSRLDLDYGQLRDGSAVIVGTAQLRSDDGVDVAAHVTRYVYTTAGHLTRIMSPTDGTERRWSRSVVAGGTHAVELTEATREGVRVHKLQFDDQARLMALEGPAGSLRLERSEDGHVVAAVTDQGAR